MLFNSHLNRICSVWVNILRTNTKVENRKRPSTPDNMSEFKLFKNEDAYDVKLIPAAEVAVKQVLDVKKGETAAIITNPNVDVLEISMAVFDAIYEAGGTPTLIVQPMKTQIDEANPEVLSALASEPDIGISISEEKLGKDPDMMAKPKKADGVDYTHIFDYLLHGKKTLKAFWSPSVTKDMFARTVPIDYPLLRKRCGMLKEKMDRAEKALVTSPGGTDIEVVIKGRKADKDDGDFTRGGLGGNLPAGEVYISPTLEASRGKIAFDGSISSHEGEIIIEKTIDCKIENGYVTKISGGPDGDLLKESISVGERTAREFVEAGKIPKKMLDHYVKNASNIGELGIGLNPKAKIVGNMLEDEKVMSTCHLAIGANYDEDAKAMIHLDGLVQNPTIELVYPSGKSETVMQNGNLIED